MMFGSLGIIASPESAELISPMPKQDDPFKGSFAGSQIPSLNQVVQITFSVSPEQDMPNSTIKFFLPPDVELVAGDLEWYGDLKKDQHLTINVSIKVAEKVEQHIKAEAITYIDGIKVSRSYYFLVSTVDKINSSPITGPEGTLMMQTPAKSVDTGNSTSSASSQAEVNSPGNITIVGRWVYVNEDGGYSPMRNVLVKFYDSETLSDEYLGYDYTDNNGDYSFTCNNDDGWLQGGRDVYVHVWAYNAAAKATTGGGSQYIATTETKDDVSDGTVDFGTLVPTSSNEAWQAVDAALSEYRWIHNQVSWTRSRITIKWPTGDWAYSTGDGILLCNKATFAWDHVTVHHEYGHCVQWTAYGNAWPPCTIVSHWIGMESEVGFAILEGWAEFMQCVVDNDPNNLQGGGGNIETNNWYNWQDSGDLDGDIIEGCIASILWDIFDPANDDGLNMGFDEIWTIMLNDDPGSIHTIWTKWFDRGYGHSQALWQIYRNYGINKDTTDPTEVSGLNSTSHLTSTWSNDPTIDVAWTQATDNLSGVAGYGIYWGQNSPGMPSTTPCLWRLPGSSPVRIHRSSRRSDSWSRAWGGDTGQKGPADPGVVALSSNLTSYPSIRTNANR